MFTGHFALGFAAKRWVPRVSLAALFVAAQFADLLWPLLVAAGVEQVRIAPGITASTPLDFLSYPYSHSLVALLVWGALFAWICRRMIPDARVFGVVLALVVSHWVLDVITHRPDMPLYPGGPRFGFGLWNSVIATRIVEVAMYLTGLLIYARTTTARDGIGRWAFWTLATFLLVGFLSSSAPPPSITALWSMALGLGGLTMIWAWWADRHRGLRAKG
jgi:hypothetical protein